MIIETLLRLGKVDPGLRPTEKPFDILTVPSDVTLIESLVSDRLVFEETKDNPFVIMAC